MQQLEAESQRLLSAAEAGQPNGRSEASCGGGSNQGAQAVHSLELLDFSPNWDFTLGGSKVGGMVLLHTWVLVVLRLPMCTAWSCWTSRPTVTSPWAAPRWVPRC